MGAGAFAAHHRHAHRGDMGGSPRSGGSAAASEASSSGRGPGAGGAEALSGSSAGPHLSNYEDGSDAYLAGTRGISLATSSPRARDAPRGGGATPGGASAPRGGSGAAAAGGLASRSGGPSRQGSGVAGALASALLGGAGASPPGFGGASPGPGPSRLGGGGGGGPPTISVDVGGGLLEDLEPSSLPSALGGASGGGAYGPPPDGGGDAAGAAGTLPGAALPGPVAGSLAASEGGIVSSQLDRATFKPHGGGVAPPPSPPSSFASHALPTFGRPGSAAQAPASASARASRLSPPTPFGVRQVGPEATFPPLAAPLALWVRQTPTARRLTLLAIGLFLFTWRLASRAPPAAAKSLIVSFGSLWAPLAMTWMWASLVAHWEAGRVAYDACFSPEDARHLPTARELGSIAVGLTLPGAALGALYALVAGREVAALQAALGPGAAALWTPASRVPGLLAFAAHALTVALVLLPRPLPRPDARRLFARTVGHVFAAGWRMVSWSDFLLADITTSLARPAAEFARVSCLALGGARSPLEAAAGPRCGDPGPLPAALQALPYFLRLVQCVRVFCDTRQQPNLWNALKYTTALPSAAAAYGFGAAMYRHSAARAALATALAAAGGAGGAGGAAALAAVADAQTALDAAAAALAVAQRRAFAAALVNSLYSFFWDVERDWGIGLFTGGRFGDAAKEAVARLRRAGAELARRIAQGTDRRPADRAGAEADRAGTEEGFPGAFQAAPLEVSLDPSGAPARSPAPVHSFGGFGNGSGAPVPLRRSGSSGSSGSSGGVSARAREPVLALPRAVSYSPRFYALLVLTNLFLRHAWMLKFSARARASLAVMALAPVLEAYRRYQWAFVRIEAELRKIQTAKPEIGRLVPPAAVRIEGPGRDDASGKADDERAPPPRQQSHSA